MTKTFVSTIKLLSKLFKLLCGSVSEKPSQETNQLKTIQNCYKYATFCTKHRQILKVKI